MPMTKEKELLTIKQASRWATKYLNKDISPSNISYLIQYGRVRKVTHNGVTHVYKHDLVRYYDSFAGRREAEWKKQLGKDLDWELSFDYLNENDGAVFEVLHTKNTGIDINARLIDVNKIIEIKYPKTFTRWRIKYNLVSFFGFCGLLVWGLYEMITKGAEVTTITMNGDKVFNYGPLVMAIGIAWLLTFIPDLRDFCSYYRLPKWSRRW